MIHNLFFVIAHNIRSLYNVGSIFRTCDALAVDKLYLTGYSGTPKNFRLAKTALGAENAVAWEHVSQLSRLLKKFKQEKVVVAALENNVPGTIDLKNFKPKFPLALLVGEETRGIKKNYLKMCDAVVEIPMRGKKESLNVSVAFGMAAYLIQTYGRKRNF
jgi:23S rRNA (guanosine2251-2'-O)-methyltransferase